MLQRTLQRFIPSFLKEIDRRLLTDHPVLWTTKIHYVLFYGSLGVALYLFLGLLQPLRIDNVPSLEARYLLMLFPAGIGLLLWAYYVNLFNVRASFGQISRFQELRNLLIYSGIIGMFVLLPLAHVNILNYRVSNILSDQEISEDMNKLNLGSYMIYKNFYLHDFKHEIKQEYELDNEFLALDRAGRLKVAEEYFATLEKYSRHRLNIPANSVVTHYESYGTPFFDSNYDADFWDTYYDATGNIKQINNSKNNSFFFVESIFIHISIGFIGAILLVLVLFWKNGWRKMALAVILGILGMMGGVFIISLYETFIDRTFHILDTEIFAASLFIAAWGLLVAQSYVKWHSSKLKNWKAITLIVACAMTPFLPTMITLIWDKALGLPDMFMADYGDLKGVVYFVFYGGVLAGFMSLHLYFTKKFTELDSQPKTS